MCRFFVAAQGRRRKAGYAQKGEEADVREEIDDLSLEVIMRRWPQTLEVFLDWRLHCIGCPIADFHRLADAAAEHGYALEDLRAAVELAIGESVIAIAPPRSRRR
jgi:hybrid cluster-associated redox disulfide protein